MKKFEYEIGIPAETQREADEKMKAVVLILSKLSAPELKKISEVVSSPMQLAVIKSKLGL